MQLSNILKVFKKGSKAASKYKGKKGPAPGKSWPSGIRIGVFGHANSGKTIYFTVLNEECKISKDLQIAVTDNATAGEFLSNYRSIWGLGTSRSAGTVVDLRGEKKFPDPTKNDKLLMFKAIVDLNKKLPIVTYDYNGEALSISQTSEQTDIILDFMAGCDGILFFYDPKLMGAELESQARVASFVNMLELLAPLHKRLPIPVAVVVTKSDILPGFQGEQQVSVLAPEDEYLVSEDFEIFLEKVLSNNRIASDSAWSGSVRNILVRLKDFLRAVLTRTLDFQMFFISATGETPEKIGTDVGRSIYAPPKKMQPIGVKEPFYWLLKSIIRNRKITKLRVLAKYVALISIIWVILFSAPFFYHFKILYDKPVGIENEIRTAYNNQIANIGDERTRIASAYRDYGRSRMVRWFFDDFEGPAKRIADGYERFDQDAAINKLNGLIQEITFIVKTKQEWPKLDPADSSVTPTKEQDNLMATLESFFNDNPDNELSNRSKRVRKYWDLFIEAIRKPDDTAVWDRIIGSIDHDKQVCGNNFNKFEETLGRELLNQKDIKVKKVAAQKAAVDLSDKIDAINSNPSPDYRLGKAVDELTEIMGKLDPQADKKYYQMINSYIKNAKLWKNTRKYQYKVESVPGDGHLHIAVTEKGKQPNWSEKNGQLLPGSTEDLEWKIGDIIHIVYHEPHVDGIESWGVKYDDIKTLDGQYSLFDMENGIVFEGLGKKAVVKFVPNSLQERLPELK
ncbi:MAG: hypothetical protein ACOYVF_08400 [Candidatus Zixiibacteriota bacterium]